MLYFTIFECLSQIRNWIFNVICCGSSDNQWYTMKGSCSFWWYWWICWPSLFRIVYEPTVMALYFTRQCHRKTVHGGDENEMFSA
jgi:hypothetical protein